MWRVSEVWLCGVEWRVCRFAGVGFLCKLLGVQVLPMLLLPAHPTPPNPTQPLCDMLMLVVRCRVAGVASDGCEVLV